MKARTFITIAVSWVLTDIVSGHGYMKSPRSRNFVAFEDGVWWGGNDSNPKVERYATNVIKIVLIPCLV